MVISVKQSRLFPFHVPTDQAVVVLCSLTAASLYGWAWITHPRRPFGPAYEQGWWTGFDQARYLRATLAWAAGDLRPSEHWYLPGYSLLGVPFVHLTPANPFLLPNLAMLLAALWLVAALSARLMPDWRRARTAGALTFLGCAVLHPVALDAWVTPWTTTPASVLTLSALVLMADFVQKPLAWHRAFWAGMCGTGVAAFRPTDAVMLLACLGVAGGIACLAARSGKAALRAAGAGAAGAAIAAVPLLLTYAVVHGTGASDYVASSATIGFEWRLLPLRWVEIVIAQRPIFPDGISLVQAFPWTLLGVGGLAAALAQSGLGRMRLVHALVTGAVATHIALYLSYRDLHAPGLWQYYNNHYFKWDLLLLGLYAVQFGALAVRRRWGAVAAGVVLLVALTPWRAQLGTPRPVTAAISGSGRTLRLSPLRLGVQDAILVAAEGQHDDIYFGEHALWIGDRAFNQIADFKTFPVPGGLMVTPLRPLPEGVAEFTFAPGVTRRPGVPVALAHQVIHFGLPCWLPRQAGCDPAPPIPPPARELGEPLVFDGTEAPFLLDGWAYPELGGRWTTGKRARMRLAMVPIPLGPVTLTLIGSAIAPPGLAPLHVELHAGDAKRATWRIGDGETHTFKAVLPRGSIGPDGVLAIELRISNPRSPQDVYPNSTDVRQLGLHVRSVTVSP